MTRKQASGRGISAHSTQVGTAADGSIKSMRNSTAAETVPSAGTIPSRRSRLEWAARGGEVGPPPVWFMRQAGRSLPEYRAARSGIGMLEACRRPDLVCELSLQPVRRHRVDAAILFSDIVVPLAAAGVDVDIVAGTGPVVAEPVRDAGAVARIPALDPAEVEPVAQACRLLVAELGEIPLIGFAGAPFTLASYLVEGGPSRTYSRTKALMYGAPAVWHALAAKLADISGTFLRTQIEAGARVVQLFDSWAGALSDVDYRRFVLPHSRAVLTGLADTGVPRIHFGVGTGHLLPAIAEAGTDVVGVDWRTPLPAAARLVPGHALQGNLDPAILGAPWPAIEAEVRRIVCEGRAAPGHIFNLGHGVQPDTDPDVLTRVVGLIHGFGAEGPGDGAEGPGDGAEGPGDHVQRDASQERRGQRAGGC